MAYNSVSILRDLNGVNAIPQYYSSGTGSYEPILGNVAPFTQLVDANGLPLFSSTNPANTQNIVGGNPVSSGNPLPVSVVGSSATNAVTLASGTTVTATKGLYVIGSGAPVVVMAGGATVTLTGIATGIVHPLSVTQLVSLGGAASVIGFY